MTKKDEKPTVSGGLKRGMKGMKELLSYPEGRFILLTAFTGLIFVWILAPTACMELRDAFPGTGINLIAFVAIIALWWIFIVKMRKRMVGEEERPTTFRGAIEKFKKRWRESEGPREKPKAKVRVTRKRTVIIERKKKD